MNARYGRLGFALAFFAVAAYALVTLTGPKGIQALTVRKAEIRKLEKQNADLAKENERLREHIERLNNNPNEQELELRNRYKLAGPRDKVFVLGKPK